jgi:hypothetical protein
VGFSKVAHRVESLIASLEEAAQKKKWFWKKIEGEEGGVASGVTVLTRRLRVPEVVAMQ